MADGVGSLSDRSTLDDRRRASACRMSPALTSCSPLSLASVVVAWMPAPLRRQPLVAH